MSSSPYSPAAGVILTLAAFSAAMALLGGCRAASQSDPSAEPPNVVILFTDDQRFNTVGALGNRVIRTPSMDRLVAEGTAFTGAHIMGGQHGALCAPSRAMLLTGRPLFRLLEKGDVIPPEHTTMPEAFADAGYATFATGKWHNDRPAFARAFQAADHIYFGGMHWPADGGHDHPLLHRYDSTGTYPPENRAPAPRFSSTMFADAAIDFIRRHAEAPVPFFAYVAFSSPHDPRTPPEPFASWYDPAAVPLPANFAPEHPFDNGELSVRDEKLLPHPRTPEAVRADLAAYYGMISEVDAQIGRILDALEETGELERTIVVFAGDNGLAVGSHGLLGKQNLYDHSMRVPLVIRGPGVPRDVRRDALVYQYDLFPTLAKLAGVDVPATVEGEDLSDVLASSDASVREAAFYAYRDLQRGVRTADDWKLIRYNVRGVERAQLFNLADDPNEMNDLSADPAHAARLRMMDSLLVAESRANHDPLDLGLPRWGR